MSKIDFLKNKTTDIILVIVILGVIVLYFQLQTKVENLTNKDFTIADSVLGKMIDYNKMISNKVDSTINYNLLIYLPETICGVCIEETIKLYDEKYKDSLNLDILIFSKQYEASLYNMVLRYNNKNYEYKTIRNLPIKNDKSFAVFLDSEKRVLYSVIVSYDNMEKINLFFLAIENYITKKKLIKNTLQS